MGHASRTAAHAALVWTPSSVRRADRSRVWRRTAVSAARRALKQPKRSRAAGRFRVIHVHGRSGAPFAAVRQRPAEASTAMRRSVKWRDARFAARAAARGGRRVRARKANACHRRRALGACLRGAPHSVRARVRRRRRIRAARRAAVGQAGRRRRPQGGSSMAVWWLRLRRDAGTLSALARSRR